MATQNIKNNKKPGNQSPKPDVTAAKSIYNLLLKVALFSVVIVAVVLITDYKGYFNPDYSNDHTRRKWNAFYEFNKSNPVDVVLVGNSHLYTGLNPDNLSNALGANCFILASPGTTLTDTYFALKEAFSVCKPKIAIVETFTINNYTTYEIKGGTLSDQFKSFAARKNIIQKLYATPLLFTSDNYVPAWSNTIRNHSFIFNDTAQIRRNRSYKEPERSGLYLGRYNRFMSGIEDSTLLKYDKPGFVAYNYGENKASADARVYLEKTIELCRENNVKLVFMTLPMYYRHVHNYESYKNDLQKLIADANWIDFQLPYDTLAFNTDCFENTVSGNQHMTYYGARVAAYKLAAYLKSNFKDIIPNRSSDMKWKQLFYASDGYFENYPPENDGYSQLIVQNQVVAANVPVKELSLVPRDGYKKLILKIAKSGLSTSAYNSKLTIKVSASIKGQTSLIEIPVQCTRAYDPIEHYVFASEALNPELKIQHLIDITGL